ncbi:hypothetical protein EDC01DRAFT_166461 [Geopyxis carbonaria]|nr:hypothetical protein EDC01DRAFT_166461 [Geopyxis carbonaria]
MARKHPFLCHISRPREKLTEFDWANAMVQDPCKGCGKADFIEDYREGTTRCLTPGCGFIKEGVVDTSAEDRHYKDDDGVDPAANMVGRSGAADMLQIGDQLATTVSWGDRAGVRLAVKMLKCMEGTEIGRINKKLLEFQRALEIAAVRLQMPPTTVKMAKLMAKLAYKQKWIIDADPKDVNVAALLYMAAKKTHGSHSLDEIMVSMKMNDPHMKREAMSLMDLFREHERDKDDEEDLKDSPGSLTWEKGKRAIRTEAPVYERPDNVAGADLMVKYTQECGMDSWASELGKQICYAISHTQALTARGAPSIAAAAVVLLSYLIDQPLQLEYVNRLTTLTNLTIEKNLKMLIEKRDELIASFEWPVHPMLDNSLFPDEIGYPMREPKKPTVWEAPEPMSAAEIAQLEEEDRIDCMTFEEMEAHRAKEDAEYQEKHKARFDAKRLEAAKTKEEEQKKFDANRQGDIDRLFNGITPFRQKSPRRAARDAEQAKAKAARIAKLTADRKRAVEKQMWDLKIHMRSVMTKQEREEDDQRRKAKIEAMIKERADAAAANAKKDDILFVQYRGVSKKTMARLQAEREKENKERVARGEAPNLTSVVDPAPPASGRTGRPQTSTAGSASPPGSQTMRASSPTVQQQGRAGSASPPGSPRAPGSYSPQMMRASSPTSQQGRATSPAPQQPQQGRAASPGAPLTQQQIAIQHRQKMALQKQQQHEMARARAASPGAPGQNMRAASPGATPQQIAMHQKQMQQMASNGFQNGRAASPGAASPQQPSMQQRIAMQQNGRAMSPGASSPQQPSMQQRIAMQEQRAKQMANQGAQNGKASSPGAAPQQRTNHHMANQGGQNGRAASPGALSPQQMARPANPGAASPQQPTMEQRIAMQEHRAKQMASQGAQNGKASIPGPAPQKPAMQQNMAGRAASPGAASPQQPSMEQRIAMQEQRAKQMANQGVQNGKAPIPGASSPQKPPMQQNMAGKAAIPAPAPQQCRCSSTQCRSRSDTKRSPSPSH